jgi:hypothetical protein
MVTEVAMTGRETPQGLLGAHKHIGHVLVLAEQWQVEDDLQGLCVCGHHNELSNTAVKCFSGWGREGKQRLESDNSEAVRWYYFRGMSIALLVWMNCCSSPEHINLLLSSS